MPDLPIVLPTDHHIIANGMRFHYLDWGGDAKETMLFLHGGGLNAHTWDIVSLAMRGDYRCIAVDLRGHGDSEWSPIADYRMDAHRADVAGLVQALGLHKFVLVGMSLGAITAIRYAGAHPETLSALVIIDAGPKNRQSGTQRIREFSSDPERYDSLDAFVEKAAKFNPLRDPAVLRRSAGYNLRQGIDGKWGFKHDQRRFEEDNDEARAARNEALWQDVARITCPTLVVRGGKSDVFLDEDATDLAAKLADGRWVRVEGAGHTVQGDQPKALVGELRQFLGLPQLG